MHPTDVNTTTTQLGPGALLDARFRLASVASRGPSATVFNALDERSRQRVRVRVTVHAPDPSLLGIVHPAMPAVLGCGQLGREHWVALEWFDGAPIELTRRSDWLELGLTALEALERVHASSGRAHGSLGLASLWLGRDGQLRLVDATAPDGVLALASVPWASPERLRGEARDVRSDVYALAAILVGLASGRPPFGSNPVLARSGHLERPLPDIEEVPAGVLAVLRRAMHKEPARRFASAASLREALIDAAREPLRVARPPEPELVRELPPAETEEIEDIAMSFGTLEPSPSRVVRPAGGPLPMLLVAALLGVPLSLAAWVALMGALLAFAL